MTGRGAEDAPRAAVRADPLADLSRRITLGVTVWLAGAAAVAWVLVVRQQPGMTGMAAGLAQVAAPMAMPFSGPVFLGMWVGMMVAMMFPTAVPLVAAHRLVVRRRGEGAAPTLALVGGYLLVWTAAGLLPLAALTLFRQLAAPAGGAPWLTVTAGATLVLAGAYQFTSWKSICLGTCRSPFAFLAQHDFGGGSRAAWRAGLAQGTYCLGCCWALMSVLLVVGLMNLVWMVALSLVFLAEKVWRHGWALPRIIGTALIALGVVVALYPPLLPLLAGLTPGPAPM
ncbi:DUF2182 domain-containing protein [Georgenia thermotolerans]|uniref:DUF2182 domain-containing protein n=1 Tax=Georgenia thermotolerans TaxID=527326 RepID=A0A7J5URX6_9MICO|nr:DUF2182 domain-containing protein [Georgenia thermotolerans]KAE8765202.1 DUF2182 domain-containing protein [Georgenia thermotolerans]